MKRMEKIAQRRPFILSDVVLQSNPNDVTEWLKRIELSCKHESNNKSATL